MRTLPTSFIGGIVSPTRIEGDPKESSRGRVVLARARAAGAAKRATLARDLIHCAGSTSR